VLALADTMPGPHVAIRDGDGRLLLEETLVLTDLVEPAYGTTVAIPSDGRRIWVGAKPDSAGDDWRLVVFELGDNPDPARLALALGEKGRAGGLEFEFVSLSRLPATFEQGFPLPSMTDGGSATGTVLLQMKNAGYGYLEGGSAHHSQYYSDCRCHEAGGAVSAPSTADDGPPTLLISGVGPSVLALVPGESSVVGDYQYTFLGQREFAGIEVRRDQSDNLIWAGAGILLLGLGITFYVPRRRLWAKIVGDRTYLAGVAGHLANFRREMAKLGAEAGSPDALEEERQDGSS